MSRSWIYRDHIQWHILGYYFIGAVICTGIFSWLAFVPNKAVLFLCLGLLPFMHLLLPKGYALDITRPGNAVSCGFLVSASLLIAGVSGPILDIYYVKTSLSRFQIHATKGVTQGIGHLVKVAYFIVILGLVEDGLGPFRSGFLLSSFPWLISAALHHGAFLRRWKTSSSRNIHKPQPWLLALSF